MNPDDEHVVRGRFQKTYKRFYGKKYNDYKTI